MLRKFKIYVLYIVLFNFIIQTETRLNSSNVVKLSVNELGDVLKSRELLTYLFSFNGHFIRVFYTVGKSIYISFL